MTEVSDGKIQKAALDHFGLVAAICEDLKIAQRIDDRLHCDNQRKVKHSSGRHDPKCFRIYKQKALFNTSIFESKAI